MEAADGPFTVTATVTIPYGVTVTIEPGTQVYLASGANYVVASGGRLLAEGTEAQPIRFSRVPAGAAWGIYELTGLPALRDADRLCAIRGNSGSPTILCSSATVYLRPLTFRKHAVSYLISTAAPSRQQLCIPTATATFEGVHGTGGIKSGGRGSFAIASLGSASALRETTTTWFDFTGGNRPGPIIQFINNCFIGTDDDILDLDGTDAWIEGNIFMHIHRLNSPDSSSAISGGNDGGGGTGSRRAATAIDYGN
jgi:hypothetical protein